jgi:hypothetical protein
MIVLISTLTECYIKHVFDIFRPTIRSYKSTTDNDSTPLDVTERVDKLVTDNKGVSDFPIKIIA